MATMITAECISCGACEPECPNNAISQSEEIYVIDPLLCTECVGFHDFEACAAVCPVDCCVTDPNNPESEEVLISRARSLHADVNFGESFESRFRSGTEKPRPVASKSPTAQAPAAAAAPGEAADRPVPILKTETVEPPLAGPPSVEQWPLPVHCHWCGETYFVPVKHFTTGNVFFCPRCHKSAAIKDRLNYQISAAVKEFEKTWESEAGEFLEKREEERRTFAAKREKDLQAFEKSRHRAIETLKAALEGFTRSEREPASRTKRTVPGLT